MSGRFGTALISNSKLRYWHCPVVHGGVTHEYWMDCLGNVLTTCMLVPPDSFGGAIYGMEEQDVCLLLLLSIHTTQVTYGGVSIVYSSFENST